MVQGRSGVEGGFRERRRAVQRGTASEFFALRDVDFLSHEEYFPL